MLLNLREYHRIALNEPQRVALDQALALLARHDIRTVPLAGGDSLVGAADLSVEAVVDLQGLGLDSIRPEGGVLYIGAMATRSALAQDQNAGQFYNGMINRAARLWGGSVQRNRATVGGALAVAAPNDPLVAALLACDARVVLYTLDGYSELPLEDFLSRRGELLGAPALIVEVNVPPLAAKGAAALETVARTPSDSPIVLAAAVLAVEGSQCTSARLVLGGVAATPIRIAEAEAMLTGQALNGERIPLAAERAASLVQPAGDPRGSVEYRRAMARVLSERALREATTMDDRP